MTVRIVDGNGRPLPGIPVSLYGNAPENRADPPVDLRTGAEGRAAGDVGPGPRILSANPWRSPGARPDLWVAWKEFDAQRGAELSFELVLPARDASLALQVVDDLGAPIPGVRLSLPIAEQPSAETDAQGRAFFAQLPPVGIRVDLEADAALRKRYGVPYAAAEHVVLKAGQTASARFVLPRTGSLRLVFELGEGIDPKEQIRFTVHATEGEYDYDPVSLGASLGEGLTVEGLPPQEYGLNFELAPDSGFSAGAIRRIRIVARDTTVTRVPVQLHAGVVSGMVVDDGGRPIAGVYLSLVIVDSVSEPEYRSTSSAVDGTFRIAGVPQHRMFLNVDPRQIRDRNFAHYGTFDEPGLNLQGPMEGLRLVLQPGYAIRGRLRTASGRPVKTGTVHIDRKIFHGETWTNVDDGAFELRNLRPGEYTIWYDSGDRKKQAERKVTVGPDAGDAEVELVVRTYR